MTLGTQLRLPGQFFLKEKGSSKLKQLTEFMATLRPPPPHDSRSQRANVDRKLKLCTHVFIKNNAPISSLERTYTGTYRVLDKQEKYFTVDFGNRNHVESTDV